MVQKKDSNLLGFLRIKPIFSFQFRQGHSYEAHMMQLMFISPLLVQKEKSFFMPYNIELLPVDLPRGHSYFINTFARSLTVSVLPVPAGPDGAPFR